MKLRSLKKLIALGAIVAIALTSAITYAAWTTDSDTKAASVTTASWSTLQYGTPAGFEVTNLVPYNQTVFPVGATSSNYSLKMEISFKIEKSASVTAWKVEIADLDLDGLTAGALMYSFQATGAINDTSGFTAITETSILTQSNTDWATSDVYTMTIILDSNDAADMGKTVTFNLVLTDTTP